MWLFFFHLDYTSLSSWDEAWYAAIAQNIVKTGDYMNMTFNGQVYYDHPPMGFWLMALSMKFFGINEFSVRFTSAILGVGSSILMYLFAADLFKKKIIGFIAALIVNTSVWYVIRARSGNLDATFLFFYILTLYAAHLSTKKFIWFLVCMASFGALILSKTLAGVSSVLLIIWLLIPAIPVIIKSKRNWLVVLGGIAIAYAIINPWYSYNLQTYPDFYRRHFFYVGMRDVEFGKTLERKLQWELPIFYLHMGVRKWYKLWLAALVILLTTIVIRGYKTVTGLLQKKSKSSGYKNLLVLHRELFIVLWNAVILLPFLTTDQTHIWHLIPVYAPLALVTAYGLYVVIVEFSDWFYTSFLNKNSFVKTIMNFKIPVFVFLAVFVGIAALQIKGFYFEAFPESKYTVDEAAILKSAKKYEGQIFIDRDFIPIAVFYTDRIVREHSRESDDITTIKRVFDDNDNVVLVIRNGIIENYAKAELPYKLKEKNNSFSIITE